MSCSRTAALSDSQQVTLGLKCSSETCSGHLRRAALSGAPCRSLEKENPLKIPRPWSITWSILEHPRNHKGHGMEIGEKSYFCKKLLS